MFGRNTQVFVAYCYSGLTYSIPGYFRKKKVPEVVTTNTVPLPTDDVDELVSLIEGTHLPKSKAQSSEAAKCAKKLKKERQREKKRLEEEAAQRAEEERLRVIEQARIDAEEEAHEELLRKKREKKRKQRQNKKASKTVEPTTSDQPGTSRQPEFSPVREEPKPRSDMVTIRRHSTAPDTTVTISVKSETGDEDLLYTLVNGQVYTDSKDLPKTDLSSQGKSKGKKSKNADILTEVTKSAVDKDHDRLHTESTLRKHDSDWFGSGTNVTVPSTPTLRTDAACFTPIIPNGPHSSPCHSSGNNRCTGKPFSIFSELDSTEIDLSTLKLPPGITITKVNQPVTGQQPDHCVPMPPPGAGHYNIDSNMIVMNPDCDDRDEEEYNSDDYLFYGNRRVSEFETVLSNKEKRKRSKANKCDETEGNGSKERPVSREQTPNATNSKNGNGKRGSDAGLKSASSNSNSDRRRNSGSGKGSDSGRKGDKYKGKKDQRGDSRDSTRKSSDGNPPRNYVKITRDPQVSYLPRTSPSTTHFPNAPSPAFSDSPRPLLKITPLNPVKMADVVSGIHHKVARDLEVVVIPKDIPPSASSSQEYSVPMYLHNEQPINHAMEKSTQLKAEQHQKPSTSKVSDMEYNMWSSVPRQVEATSTQVNGFESGETSASADSSYTLFSLGQSTGLWKNPWAFDQGAGPRPCTTPFDGRPHVQTPPGFTSTSSSSLRLDFDSNDQPPKFDFQGNGTMPASVKPQNTHSFTRTTRPPEVPVTSYPMMTGQGQSSTSSFANFNRLPPPKPEVTNASNYFKTGPSIQVSYPTSFNPGMTTFQLAMELKNGAAQKEMAFKDKCWTAPSQSMQRPNLTTTGNLQQQPSQYNSTLQQQHPKVGNGFGHLTTAPKSSEFSSALDGGLRPPMYNYHNQPTSSVPVHQPTSSVPVPPRAPKFEPPSIPAPPSGPQYSLFGCTSEFEHW